MLVRRVSVCRGRPTRFIKSLLIIETCCLLGGGGKETCCLGEKVSVAVCARMYVSVFLCVEVGLHDL